MNSLQQLIVHFKDDDLKTSVYLMFAGKKVRPDDLAYMDLSQEIKNYHPTWYNYPGFSRTFDRPSAHTNYFQWIVEEHSFADHDILQRLDLLGVPRNADLTKFIQGPHHRVALFVNEAEDRFRKKTFHITIAKHSLGDVYDILKVELDVPIAVEHPQYMSPDAPRNH